MAKSKKFLFLTFGLFGLIFFHLARQMFQVKQDGLYVGQVNLYGDLVFHLGLINKFIQTGEVMIESPVFSGGKPNYPIFADYLTAQFAKITGVDFALFLTTFIFGLIVIYVARIFILQFVKNEKVVFLSLLIFLLNGGLGFTYFFQDFLASGQGFLEFLFEMPRQYTDIKEQGYWWINTYLAYFLPQRGFLVAFPITLIVLSLLYFGARRYKTYFFVLAGLLAGVLPLVQAHSLFVIFLISVSVVPAILYRSTQKQKVIFNWGIFAALTAAIALPVFASISSATNPLEFVRLDSGWTSNENLIWFWIKNLGLFAPLLLISLVWLLKKNRHLFELYAPFAIIFIISNIFIFQPWEFDNSKLLVYWFFASSIVVAYFIYDVFLTEAWPKKVLGIILIFFTVLAGSLDVFRTFTPVTNYQIFSASDLEVAESVKKLTPKDAVFTTAPAHNHPIPALAGRSTIIGFHGWAWSHGLPYGERASDVNAIYLGGQQAEQIISKYKVNYVTVGPREREDFSINESYFSKYPSISLGVNWIIYDVSNLWSDSNEQN